MRVKIPRWEIAVICSALLFPGTSLSAQEVGQEEKEVKEMRQDVEQLQQDVRQLREEVRRLQEEIHGFRHNSFPQCGADTVAPYVPHHFIHRLGIEARPQYVFPTNPFLQGENERTVETHPEFICRSSEILFQVSSQHLCRPHLWRSLSRFRLGFHYLWRQKATG